MEVTIVGDEFKSASEQFSDQICVNMYPVRGVNQNIPIQGQGSDQVKAKSILLPSPGLKPWISFSDGQQVRGMYRIDQELYIVVDYSVYLVNPLTKSTIYLGQMTNNTGQVQMIANLTQIKFLDTKTGQAYYYVRGSGTSIQQIVDINYVPEISMCQLDGYSMGITTDNTIQLSEVNDFSTYSPGLESSINAYPDMLIGIATAHRQIYLFTNKRTIIYQDVGNYPFPLAQMTSTDIGYGLAATLSIVNINNGIMALGYDETGALSVFGINGYTPSVASTEGINLQLAELKDPSSAFAFGYSFEGHVQYVLTCPVDQKTYIYDVTTSGAQGIESQNFSTAGFWHERRSSQNGDTSLQSMWLASCASTFRNVILIGDQFSGTVYSLERKTYTENFLPILRERKTAPISQVDLNLLTCDSLQIDCEVGSAPPINTAPGITSLNLTNPGSGYSSTPLITFSSGDAAATPILGYTVGSLTIINSGSNYTSAPTVSITGGGGSGATATATLDQNIQSFTIANAGSGYTSAPTVTIGSPIIAGGNIAVGTAVVGFPLITLAVTAPGSNYTSAPTVSITGGGGSGATATASLEIVSISILNRGAVANGSGIGTWPLIISTPDQAGGVQATGTYTVSLPGYVTSTLITNAGSGYSIVPTITPSTPTGGWEFGYTAVFQGVCGIAALTITAPGSNYTSAPTVSITGGGGSGATATATVATTGSITSITVSNSGSGYTSAPTVSITGGGGSGATATAVMQTGVGIGTLTITNSGSAYTSLPTIGFSGGGGSGATATASLSLGVTNLTVTNSGSNYSSSPSVTFSGGGGSGTSANATLSSTGYIQTVYTTNSGSNYITAPTVSLSEGGGSGAAITANLPNIPTLNAFNPQLMLETSYDGGVTWGQQQFQPLGLTGQTITRLKWYNLGQARAFCFRIKFADNSYCSLFSASAQFSVGDS